MSRKKISTTVYLTASQDESLKRLSARTRVPIAEYIREGITMALRKHGEPVNSFETAADDERFDLSAMLRPHSGFTAPQR